jgi:2-dehydro-3-deoxygalactonokinase
MKHFLSCDWGTTSFRLRLVEIYDGKILAEEISGEGIAATFERWRQSGYPEEKRISFYLEVIGRHIKKIAEKTGTPLTGVKLVVSGMASSSIGFIDIPYSIVPLPVDGSGIQTAFLNASEDFEHDVLVISGVRTADDVMRGEETQLIGCINPDHFIKNELFIFPGTHSKHIQVQENQLTGFKTYMTGELFSLLAQKSILKNAVEAGGAENALSSFKKGISDSITTNLLHAIFRVRTNELFNVYPKNENYHYLSGLIIGAELKDLIDSDAETINLLCGPDAAKYYQTALEELVPQKNINVFSAKRTDEATVLGQLKIANQLKIFA